VPPAKPDLPFKPPLELESDLVLSVMPTVTLQEMELVPMEPDYAKLHAKLTTVLTLLPTNALRPVNLKTAELVKLVTFPNVQLAMPDTTRMPQLNNALLAQLTVLLVIVQQFVPLVKMLTV